MAKNRDEIIRSAKDILNWDVNDPVYRALAIRMFDNAYKRTASECPSALVPDEIRQRLPASYTSGTGDAVDSYVSSTADPFVLEFSDATESDFAPTTNGEWDGIYWIEVTLSDGTLFRCQCREFWTSGAPAQRYVTIDRPWSGSAFTNLSYRLHVPYLWLRDDYETVEIGQLFGTNGGPIHTKSLGTAITRNEWSNVNTRQFGYPEELRREVNYQQPAPNIAPILTTDDGTWGDEPWGVFEYCFTYIWGYRDGRHKSPSGNFIPLFESSASPVSEQVTVPDAVTVVDVALPNIAWQLNYGDALTLRYGKTGWKKRLYRRRVSVLGGSNPSIEYPNVFQMLVDVDDLTTSFTDDGSIVPDYTIRLNDIHGYYAWSMWPLPQDGNILEYQLSATRRPEPLLNGSDSPRIVPSCEDALTFYLVAYIARHDKDTATAELYEGKALQVLKQYIGRHANPTGMVEREPWDGGYRSAGWPVARMV